jgi:hypothetical protein
MYGTGRAMTMRSVAMFRTPSVIMAASKLPHFPGIVGFQFRATGRQLTNALMQKLNTQPHTIAKSQP